jgi:hypothetical protein
MENHTHTHYTPTIKRTIDELVKFWLTGYRWPNGDVVTVYSVSVDLTHDATAVYITPVCDSPTPEQLQPQSSPDTAIG